MSDTEVLAQTRSLALVAIGGVAAFAVLVAVIPLLKEGYSPVADAISDAARGQYGYLQAIAFVALGVGSIALGWGLVRTLGGKAGRIAARSSPHGDLASSLLRSFRQT